MVLITGSRFSGALDLAKELAEKKAKNLERLQLQPEMQMESLPEPGVQSAAYVVLGDDQLAPLRLKQQKLLISYPDLASLASLDKLADELVASYEIAVVFDVGSGIVPLDASKRQWREIIGRLGCLLAERSDSVVRVCCGIPLVLKGDF